MDSAVRFTITVAFTFGVCKGSTLQIWEGQIFVYSRSKGPFGGYLFLFREVAGRFIRWGGCVAPGDAVWAAFFEALLGFSLLFP